MSVFLQTATRFLAQIMFLISILLVLRGHNYVGGGFIGALVASLSLALYTIAFRLKIKRFNYWMPKLICVGLVCIGLSFLLPVFKQLPSLTGLWVKFSFFKNTIKLGTPLLFDFGIYFLIGASLSWLVSELEDLQT